MIITLSIQKAKNRNVIPTSIGIVKNKESILISTTHTLSMLNVLKNPTTKNFPKKGVFFIYI